PTGRGPLIAVPPQECGHLGLNRALQQQLRAQLGDPLNRARQILAAGEHLIDLRAQPLGGRYSLRHGRRLLPQTCWSSTEPTSDSFYTAPGTRPSRTRYRLAVQPVPAGSLKIDRPSL